VSAATLEKQQTVYLDGKTYVIRGNNIVEVKR
jgi:small nuclear ribonucleoprotein (snRNP)-like protein